MDALESPIEALALNYLTYGFLTAVNNIWAWLAVITAAVGFWRIRALSSPSVSAAEMSSRGQDAASTSSVPPRAAAQPSTATLSAPSKTSCRVLEREGSTKMKFSLYYEEEDFRDDEDSGESEDGGGGAPEVMSEKLERWCDDWERMIAVRMGDMGWYRWQDMTVLDGSVVRLWDGRRRRQAAAELVVDGGVAW